MLSVSFLKAVFDGRRSKKVNNTRFPKEEDISIEERVRMSSK